MQGAHARLAAAEAQLERALEDSLMDDADDFDDDVEEEPAADGEDSYPDSFSRVDLSLPDAEIRRRFPAFPVHAFAAVFPVKQRLPREHCFCQNSRLLVRCVILALDEACRAWCRQGTAGAGVAELSAGMMLYLPTGCAGFPSLLPSMPGNCWYRV